MPLPGFVFSQHPTFCNSPKGYEMQKVARVKEPRKGEEKGKKKVWNGQWQKIAIAFKYGECHDSSENSDFLLLRQKDPFAGWAIFRNILSKFQRVHIFVKSRKVQNTVYSSINQDAGGIYPKLYVFNTPVQKEGNLPGFHIHTVCNLLFGHSSELKVILN